MKAKTARSCGNSVLRLATLAAFFQFSGLNNGFTAVACLSPLNVPQSTLLTCRLAAEFSRAIFQSRQVTGAMQSAYAWTGNFALKVQGLVRQVMADWHGLSPIATHLTRASVSKPQGTLGIYQETYIKERKENWHRSQALKDALSAASPHSCGGPVSFAKVRTKPVRRPLQMMAHAPPAPRLFFADADSDDSESSDAVYAWSYSNPIQNSDRTLRVFSFCYKSFTHSDGRTLYNMFQSFDVSSMTKTQTAGARPASASLKSVQISCQTLSSIGHFQVTKQENILIHKEA